MSRAHASVAVLILLLGSACHHGLRPGVTSLASAPISPAPPGATDVVTTTAEAPSSATGREKPRPQLVSPGLDNTITGGIASTGAPLTCGVP